MVTRGLEAESQFLLLTNHQKVSSSLLLPHKACVIHLTLSHGVRIVSSPIITEGWGQRNQIFRERAHIHITCITVQCYNCSILLLVLISYCANLQIKLYHKYHKYVCIEKTIVYTELGTVYSFRCLLGVFSVLLAGKGGLLHGFLTKDSIPPILLCIFEHIVENLLTRKKTVGNSPHSRRVTHMICKMHPPFDRAATLAFVFSFFFLLVSLWAYFLICKMGIRTYGLPFSKDI